jgi:hypothetical protein
LTVLTLEPALRALPTPVQLRINQLAEKITWHRDCHCQRYINANQKRAYQLFEERECRYGHAVDDWIDAAIQLAPERATQVQFNRAE